jgi:elongation factor Ts
MQITAEQVKELREQTGVSVMQCKRALEEAGGDMEKALMILKKHSADIASKKSERIAKDGLVTVKTAPGKAVMVVLNCETDFVAKNEDFIKLADQISDLAIQDAEKAKSAAPEMINLVIQKTGENIQLGEITEIKAENIGVYVHNGKSGVMVALAGGTPEAAKDIAMHIAAMKPEYVKVEDIDQAMRDKVADLFAKEVEESNKPEEIKKKMLQGKIDAYFKERVLLEQPFIKNPDMTIGALLKQSGGNVVNFVRYSLLGK